MKTIKRGIKMDNFDYLTEVLNDYCIKHDLPIDMSADDMIYYFYNNFLFVLHNQQSPDQ